MDAKNIQFLVEKAKTTSSRRSTTGSPKGGHNGRQPLPAELPRCWLPRWGHPPMAAHTSAGLQFSRCQVHAAHLAARPPHAIHRVPDRARAGPHLRPRTIRRKRNTISDTVKGFLMQSSKDRIVIVIHGDKVYTYMRKYIFQEVDLQKPCCQMLYRHHPSGQYSLRELRIQPRYPQRNEVEARNSLSLHQKVNSDTQIELQ